MAAGSRAARSSLTVAAASASLSCVRSSGIDSLIDARAFSASACLRLAITTCSFLSAMLGALGRLASVVASACAYNSSERAT